MPKERYNYLSATANKLMPWVRHIAQRKGPISLTVFPTNRCNLNCEFCSNCNRDTSKELALEQIIDLCNQFKIKSVEISGGGDPCCYSQINDLIYHLQLRGILIGMITNGIALKTLTPLSLVYLRWLRLSVNGLIDHQIPIDWEYLFEYRKSIGISYILHDKSIPDYQTRLLDLQKKFPQIEYCKVCVDSRKVGSIDRIEKLTVDEWMYKVERAWVKPPTKCYQHVIKPVLTAEGFLMPCSAIELSKGCYEKSDSVSIEDCKNYTPYHCKSPYCPHQERNNFLNEILCSCYDDNDWEFV